MGNSTFSGPIRSENGFQSVTKSATTGAITVTGEFGSVATLPTEAGTGITTGTGTVYASSVTEQGGVVTTKILVDLTGLRSTANERILGVDGTTLPCHIGQITTARNGTILTGRMTCFEAPTGGDPDVDVYSAVEGDGDETDLITALDETKLVDAADATLGSEVIFSALPAANEYLYLVCGTTTDADFTAGKLLIELIGYRA
jgi:hypothetical protein